MDPSQVQQPQVAQNPEPAPVAPLEPTQLPQDTRERTRREFEGLVESNRRLFEANELLRKEMESTRKPAAQPAPAQVPQVNAQDFVEVDPTTGDSFINEAKLRAKLSEVTQEATQAKQRVDTYIKQQEQREIDRQSNEAFQAYPELKPGNEKFDVEFNKQVRGVLLDSMYYADDYGGRTLSFKEAADFVKSRVLPANPAPTEATPADNAGQALKEQASAQATSNPAPAPAISDDAQLAALQMNTRKGDDRALAERLMYTEHIVPRGDAT